MAKLTRREFLKLAGVSALLASLDWEKIIRVAAEEIKKGGINIVWFEAQDCAGDTTALIQATKPDILDVLGGSSTIVGPGAVRLLFHETIMLSWGERTPEFVKKLREMSFEELQEFVAKLPPDDPLRKQLLKLLELGYTPGALLTSPVEMLEMAAKGELDPFVLVLEGSIPIDEKAGGPPGSGYYCFIGFEGGKPITCLEWLRRLLPRAVAVIAVGNCASYGGLVANRIVERDFVKSLGFTEFEKWEKEGWSRSPTGAIGFFPDKRRGHKGLIDLLPEAEPFRRFAYGECRLGPGEIREDCRPAIAVPGCPANGDAQLRVIANVVLWAKGLLPLPELDEYWRPKFIYGHTTHEQCPRAAWYAAGLFRKYPGEPTSECLYSIGCKGPISHCPWNRVGWVNGVGGPTRVGGPCIGCTEPGFTDEFEPFYEKLPYVGASVRQLEQVAVITAAGIAAAGVVGGIWTELRGRREMKEKSESKS